MKYKILITIIFLAIFSKIIAQNIERELARLYFEKKYDLALQKADSLLQDNPNQPTYNLIKGRSLVDLGKYNEGKPFIEKAIDLDKQNSWRKAWGFAYLGLIEFITDNRETSKKSFENCTLMNATKNVNKFSKDLLNLFGLDNFYNDWKIIETDNFVFYFPPNTVVTSIDSFANLRQSAFNEINNFFKSTVPKKIDFIVWNTNEDAKEVGITQLGFSSPNYCVIHSRYNQTLGHEMTHIISYYAAKPIKTSRFINEGIAVAFDLTKQDKLELALRFKAEDNYTKNISIIEAWNNTNVYPEWVYYHFAGEFIKRLLKLGQKEEFFKLIRKQSYSSARNIYGDELEVIINDLEKEIN